MKTKMKMIKMLLILILLVSMTNCKEKNVKVVVPHVVTNIDTNRVFDPVTQQYKNMYIIKIDDSMSSCISNNRYRVGDTVNFYYY